MKNTEKINKYLYKIEWCSYDSGQQVELSNNQKITKEQLDNIFVESVFEIIVDRRQEYNSVNHFEEGERFYTEDYINEFIKKYPEEDEKETRSYLENEKLYTSISSIFDYVIEIMIEKYGFKKIVYEQVIFVDGDEKIVNTERESDKNSHILDKIKKKFYKNL